MEIVSKIPFQVEMPPEKIRMAHLYYSQDPKIKYQIYYSYSGADLTEACKYLGTFNIPMEHLEIKGTEAEMLQYRQKKEDERREKFDQYLEELAKERA